MTAKTSGTIDLSKILEIYSDQPNCGAFRLTSYSDEQLKTQTIPGFGTYLEANPTVRNQTTGTLSLALAYVYGTNGADLPSPVYLKIETNPQTNAVFASTV